MDLSLQDSYKTYCQELGRTDFKGEIKISLGQRLVHATDNSIYQKIPQVVLSPTSAEDIQIAFKLANSRFPNLSFTPQGGLTATAGQGLTDGVVVDCRTYLQGVIEINPMQGWVEVWAGTTLKELNVALAQHSFEFKVQISPRDRATIGGMVANNAAGPGSFQQGRMSAQVIDCEVVVASGAVLRTNKSHSQRSLVKVREVLEGLDEDVRESLLARRKALPRNIGGYDVASCINSPNFLQLSSLLCGSEGNLGVITKVRLKITAKHAKVMLILHSVALSAAFKQREALLASGASVIEFLDDTMCQLIREFAKERSVSIPWLAEQAVANEVVLIVVYEGLDSLKLQRQAVEYSQSIAHDDQIKKRYVTVDADEMNQAWQLRRGAVGLISGVIHKGARPLAAIEDTAVPPDHLSEYIEDLRGILKRQDLVFGMYGHLDAGCIHVRPAFDLSRARERKLLQALIVQVQQCVLSHGGVLWGEHGLGYRTELAESYWGPAIMALMMNIKRAFDPDFMMNPNVLLQKEGHKTAIVDDWQAAFDQGLGKTASQASYLHCNGNSACLGDETAVMCPSYRVTGDRIQSPKGRAHLLRLWKILNTNGDDGTDLAAVESELYASLKTCLGCKACIKQCPVAVNIPRAKTEFLSDYFQRHRRTMAERLVRDSEIMSAWSIAHPKWAKLLHLSQGKRLMEVIGLIDIPDFSGGKWLQWQQQWSSSEETFDLYLWPDVWTAAYQPDIWLSCFKVLDHLGIKFKILWPKIMGKSAHVMGDVALFTHQVEQTIMAMDAQWSCQRPILMLEPSMLQVVTDEWQQLARPMPDWTNHIMSFQAWLADWLQGQDRSLQGLCSLPAAITCLQHCSEQSVLFKSSQQWTSIFTLLGCRIKMAEVGCCGMAGHFGHMAENLSMSQALFAQGWQGMLQHGHEVCATGFSCRSQASRFGFRLPHPIEMIWAGMDNGSKADD